MALSQLEKLRDQLLLHQFLQDCEELHDWIQEKSVLVQEDTYRSAKTIHSKWTRHEAFKSEILSNKERLEKVTETGNVLLQSKPEMAEMIGPKLSELGTEFVTLEKKTEEKGDRLFDSKREEIIRQGIDDVDGFAEEVLPLLDEKDDGKDLTSVNILLQKQSIWETTVMAKTRQIEDLKNQADHLSRISPEKTDEYQSAHNEMAKKFETIKGPLEQRRKDLEIKKEVFQFMRDVEDENIWMEEKMNLVTSEELGSSLQDVNMLIKKNRTLKGEIENHQPRIDTVCNNGHKLIDGDHDQSDEFARQIDDLKEKLAHLMHNLEARNVKLQMSEKVQQFFFDANEAEAWMSEQELYMMVEDRGKDEFSAQNLMKKHEALEAAVADYSENVRQLGEVAVFDSEFTHRGC